MTRDRLPSLETRRVALAVTALVFMVSALVVGSSGCSSGAVCYRKTDCALGSSCEQGQCVRQPAAVADAGVAGGAAATAALPSGNADPSQTPDAN